MPLHVMSAITRHKITQKMDSVSYANLCSDSAEAQLVFDLHLEEDYSDSEVITAWVSKIPGEMVIQAFSELSDG